MHKHLLFFTFLFLTIALFSDDSNFDSNGNCYIKYEVSGYGNADEITYIDRNGGKIKIENIVLPWEIEFIANKDIQRGFGIVVISHNYTSVYIQYKKSRFQQYKIIESESEQNTYEDNKLLNFKGARL